MNVPRRLLLIKHAMPVLDASRPPREWRLGAEGRAQSGQLAERLRAFAPLRLVASREPKALETGEILADALDLSLDSADGLQEFDRPALPLVTDAERAQMNRAIFTHPERPALGTESASIALARFSAAIHAQLALTDHRALAIVTHGTVMSLFVGAHNDTDAFELWQRLSCASIVILEAASFALLQVARW